MSEQRAPQQPMTSEPRAHISKRAKERFGVTLNSRARAKLVKQIKKGYASLVDGRQPRSIYLCWLPDGRQVKVVYDHRFGNVVTVLPEREK